MAAYGHNRYGGKRRRPRMHLLDWIVLVVTIICSTVLLLSYFAGRVNPNDVWPFAFFALAAPVLYIANVALTLYWIVRWNVVMLLPLVVLIAGWNNISSFFRPAFGKHYAEKTDAADLRLMSYNVMGFLDREDPANRPRIAEIVGFIRDRKPDIVCMQEFQTTANMPRSTVDSMLRALPYKTIHYSIPFGDAGGWGLAVYSRYPIVRSGHLDFGHSNNSSLWLDVVVPPRNDTVTIFNNHLQTTQINASDQQFITSQEFLQSNTDEKKKRVKNIVRKLRNNYKIRADQADTLASLMAARPHPMIVCGDFNDTPMSYVYRTVRGGLKDAFNEKASGSGNTYQGFFNLFRIDYVFYSGDFDILSYDSPSSDFSDHNPVIVGLRFRCE